MSSNRSLDLLYFFLSNMITGIVTLFSFSLFSKLFLPAEYGVYTLVFAAISLFGSLCFSWINHSIMRFYDEYKLEQSLGLFYSALFYGWLLSLAVLIIIIIILLSVTVWIPELSCSILILGLFILIFQSFSMSVRCILRTQQRSKLFLLITTAVPLIRLLVTLLCFYLLSMDFKALLLGHLAGDFIAGIFIFSKRPTLLFSFNKVIPVLKHLLAYGFPLMISALLYWIINSSDRFVLKIFYSDQEVGLYSMAYRFSSFSLSMLYNSLIFLAHPRIVRSWNMGGIKQAEKETKSFFSLFLMILIPATVGMIILRQQIYSALLADSYQEGTNVLVILILTAFLTGLSHYGHKSWELTGKTKQLMFLAAATAFLNLLLNFMLIPHLGRVGAAAATLISYILYCLLIFILGRSAFKADFELKILLQTLLATAVMCLVLFFCSNWLSPGIWTLILLIFFGLASFTVIGLLFGFHKKLTQWLNPISS